MSGRSKAGRVEEESKPDADDERPPICPACGVTMGIIVDEDGTTRYVCLECGFSDEMSLLVVPVARAWLSPFSGHGTQTST